MLINRGLIDESEYDNIYDNIVKKYINLSHLEFELQPKNILVTFIDSKITSIRKIEDIEKKINNGKHNIFIVNMIQTKIWEQLIDYDIEVFFNYELMINLIDHDLVPKHILLNEVEKEKFLKVHKNTNKLPKILLYDPVCRYYKAKKNDIFKIIRPSVTSGNNIYYRIVINGSLPNFEF